MSPVSAGLGLTPWSRSHSREPADPMATSQREEVGSLRDLTPYFLFTLMTACLAPVLYGYHLSELNAPQAVITCAESSKPAHDPSSLPQCLEMNSLQIGVVNSILTVGGLIGALVSGTVAAQYGRRTALLWNSSTLIIGPILEAAAPTVWVMAVGRFISGLGVGTSTVVTPLMISEIAVPKYKGFFGSFTQTSINSGIFLAQLLGFFLSYGQMWRVILGVGGLLAVAHLVFLFFIDESPKWLADNDRASEGRKVLRKLRGDHFDIQEEVAGWGIEEADELESEEQALLHDGSGPGADRTSSNAKDATKNATAGILAVLTHPHYNRAVLAVMFLMAAQQFCGINSIIVYGVSLLSSILTTSAALLNVLVAVLNFTVTLAFAPLIDRLGRKTCLLASVTGMGVSSLLLAVGIGRGINILSAIMVLTFVGFFGLGLGPIPFILSSELVGPEAVGATQSWALAASWVSTFVVTQFFPLVNEKVGKGRVYYVFFAFAMVTVLFTATFVPETKGKKDADEVWGREAEGHED